MLNTPESMKFRGTPSKLDGVTGCGCPMLACDNATIGCPASIRNAFGHARAAATSRSCSSSMTSAGGLRVFIAPAPAPAPLPAPLAGDRALPPPLLGRPCSASRRLLPAGTTWKATSWSESTGVLWYRNQVSDGGRTKTHTPPNPWRNTRPAVATHSHWRVDRRVPHCRCVRPVALHGPACASSTRLLATVTHSYPGP